MFFTLVIRNDANMNINEFLYFLSLAYQNLWKCTKLGKIGEKDKEENGRGKWARGNIFQPLFPLPLPVHLEMLLEGVLDSYECCEAKVGISFFFLFYGGGGFLRPLSRMYSLSDSNGVLKKTVKYSKNNFVFFLSTEKNRIHDERESKIISKQVRSRSQKYIPRPQHWGWAKNGKEGCTPSLPSHLINYICNE